LLALVFRVTYNCVNREEDHYCPISSPECVSQESSDERCEERSAGPGGHGCRSVDVALVEDTSEVTDQVLSDSVDGHTFSEFST